MIRNTISVEQAQQLGRLFRSRRLEMGLSTRKLALRVGVSHGTIEKIEHGARLAPRPETLKRLGQELGISSIDLFASANWLPSDELPTLQPYLRVKYGLNSTDAAAINEYLLQLQAARGQTAGPINREDET